MTLRAKLTWKTPATKTKSSRSIIRLKRKPSIADCVLADDGPKSPKPSLRGLAYFRRAGAAAMREVSVDEVEVCFSSSKIPQVRLRPVSEVDDLSDIPQQNRVLVQDVKNKFTQYRASVMFGRVFLVRSRRHLAIMDRHPDWPCEVVEAQRTAMLSEGVPGGVSSARKYARRAANTGDEVMALIKNFLAKEERHQRALRQDIAALVANFERKDGLTEADRKLIERVRMREGADEALAHLRRPTEANLDRTMLD